MGRLAQLQNSLVDLHGESIGHLPCSQLLCQQEEREVKKAGSRSPISSPNMIQCLISEDVRITDQAAQASFHEVRSHSPLLIATDIVFFLHFPALLPLGLPSHDILAFPGGVP